MSPSHDAHELHDLSPSPDEPSEEPPPGPNLNVDRRRVRINSRAAQIPPRESSQQSRVSQPPSWDTDHPSLTAPTDEAAGLLKIHSSNDAFPSTMSNASFEGKDEQTVSSGIQGGVLHHLLQAYKNPTPPFTDWSSEGTITPPQAAQTESRPSSSKNAATPRRKKWYEQEKGTRSQETLATLVGASTKLANPNTEKDEGTGPKSQPRRPRHQKRPSSGGILSMVWKAKEDRDAKIKIHVADLLKRQRYVIEMCRALMLFGAPSHRLEEYLAMSAKVLEMKAQFLYIPGCMIISFDDVLTHTAEVKIVRTTQGVNLGKLKDTHEIYKEVLHDVISLDEALTRLSEVINAEPQHPVWLNVLMYGLASAAVSTFFQARFIDMPVIFGLGCILGFLQLVLAPMSPTYATVFEVSASILMSFLSRAIGSVRGGNLFCFSALAQSSIALILPGWLVLSSALELQSKAIVPGSIRLVYAIIYSLFLGYGITVGTAIYGAIDHNATNNPTCQNPPSKYWNFLFVPLYVFFTTFTVQAKYKQMPVMIVIALAGYAVNFWSNTRFSASAPIAYTFGALAVGVMANLYSRLRHGVAAAVLLPAVYVQVPGSLASSGSISTALSTASSLLRGGVAQAADASTASLNAIVFNVAASMIQIAIGITVGLFMSAVIIYPMGKKRSGLWTL